MMWVMTHFGILMPGLRPFLPDGDERELQIRARRRRDIDYLREHFMPELGRTIALRHTDYQFRAYCTRAQWGEALRLIALEMDYVKFKETTETKHGDDRLHALYLKIWGAIYNAFPTGSNAFGHVRHANTGKRKNRRDEVRGDERRDWYEDAGVGIQLDQPSFELVTTTPVTDDGDYGNEIVDDESIDDLLESLRRGAPAPKRRGRRRR